MNLIKTRLGLRWECGIVESPWAFLLCVLWECPRRVDLAVSLSPDHLAWAWPSRTAQGRLSYGPSLAVLVTVVQNSEARLSPSNHRISRGGRLAGGAGRRGWLSSTTWRLQRHMSLSDACQPQGRLCSLAWLVGLRVHGPTRFGRHSGDAVKPAQGGPNPRVPSCWAG